MLVNNERASLLLKIVVCTTQSFMAQAHRNVDLRIFAEFNGIRERMLEQGKLTEGEGSVPLTSLLRQLAS